MTEEIKPPTISEWVSEHAAGKSALDPSDPPPGLPHHIWQTVLNLIVPKDVEIQTEQPNPNNTPTE